MAHANDGLFVWHEYLAKDLKGGLAFYSEVMGWKTQAFPQSEGGDYTMFAAAQGPMGGAMGMPAQAAAPSSMWMGSVQVADVDAAAAKVKGLGGKVWREPFEIAQVGRYAVLADPLGGSFTVVAPTTPMAKHDPEQEGEVCWNELYSPDSAAALAFYGEICGWKMVGEHDMGPMGTYRLFGIGDRQIGGMMTLKDRPTAWVHYVQTRDLDAAIARATKRGAKVVHGPMDVPGGGRVAQLVDPQGAVFALHYFAKKN